MSDTRIEHIVSKPGVCGGKPCVAGTRIRVWDIYVWHGLEGKSADEIVTGFPQLTMGDVYAALAYYWDHRDEIRRQMDEEEALVEEIRKKNPSLLKKKLAERNAANDSLPS